VTAGWSDVLAACYYWFAAWSEFQAKTITFQKCVYVGVMLSIWCVYWTVALASFRRLL